VRVDEARRDDGPVRVEDLVAVSLEVGGDLDDYAVSYSHVGPVRGCSGAVDDGTASDQQLRRLHEPRA
jgi:hypothetical protein